MATTRVDQERANEMRRLLAESGEDAVRQRYGEDALMSEEYREAQQSLAARRASERERYQEAVNDQGESEDLQAENGLDDEIKAEQDEVAEEQQELQAQEAERIAAEEQAEAELRAEQEQEEEQELQQQAEELEAENQADENSADQGAAQTERSGAGRDRAGGSESSQGDDGPKPATPGKGADQGDEQDQSTGSEDPAVAARQERIAEARERLRQDRENSREQGIDQSAGMSQ